MTSRVSLPVLVVALVMVVRLAAASSQSYDVTGTYSSNFDEVQLDQSGKRVTGSYVCCGGGTIDGRIEGSTLHYRWKQPSSEGSGVWTIEDGRLEGTWGLGKDEEGGGRWDLVRKPELAN